MYIYIRTHIFKYVYMYVCMFDFVFALLCSALGHFCLISWPTTASSLSYDTTLLHSQRPPAFLLKSFTIVRNSSYETWECVSMFVWACIDADRRAFMRGYRVYTHAFMWVCKCIRVYLCACTSMCTSMRGPTQNHTAYAHAFMMANTHPIVRVCAFTLRIPHTRV